MKIFVLMFLSVSIVLLMFGCDYKDIDDFDTTEEVVLSGETTETITEDISLNVTDETTETLNETNIETEFEIPYIEYTIDLSQFPSDKVHVGFGRIVLVEENSLLVALGYTDKELYGDVVRILYDHHNAYSVGQYVTFEFQDIRLSEKEGDPLNIITSLVYIE